MITDLTDRKRMEIYNSLTRKVEEFVPIDPPKVGLYTCGMTVYDYAHIGHGRKYVNDDLLRRTLEYLGYEVEHVQNVTDVGHLVSDADAGEDKLEKGARKHGKSVWEVAKHFTDHFYSSMDKLNILRPDIVCKATEHIEDQIDLVQTLIEKGYAYETPEAVYFDVTEFEDYGELTGQSLEEKLTAVREEVKTGKHKRNTADFALWFKRVGRFKDHVMYWDSPWGDGFPGWHIECSAMSMRYLGETIDIHTGGIDHLSVHHPNEIAQSEAATGKQFVRYWVHHDFLLVDGKKMSKSLGNIFTVKDVADKGFDPLSLRYFYLTAHYRKQQNFTWEALSDAANALKKLNREAGNWKQKIKGQTANSVERRGIGCAELEEKFKEAIADDLNMPKAIAVLWELVKADYPARAKLVSALRMDQVLGLNLVNTPIHDSQSTIQELPDEVKVLVEERERLRKEESWEEADLIRKKLIEKGYKIKDTPDGSKILSANKKRTPQTLCLTKTE